MAAPRQTATPPAHSPRPPSSLTPRVSIPRCFSWAPSPFATASVAASADCRCTFDDDVVNELIAAAEQADGFVFGSPVYYAHPSGRILSALDRAFYAGSKAFAHKPGAAVAVARRGGTSTTFDVLNKYFTINQMPVVASTYWNNVFGAMPGEAAQDAEGLATMRNIGKNMAWLLRCIEAGKSAGIEAPQADRARTNFIR
jgi:multimeric flavodoxin WrbA